MTCERCQLIEDEYIRVEAEGLTRDALMLAVATLRSDRLGLLAALEQTRRQMMSHAMDGMILATGHNAGQK